MEGPAVALLPVVPLALALAAGAPRLRRAVAALTPWAPLPALMVALFVPKAHLVAPMLLFGMEFGLDPVARALLVGSALIWLAAGFARTPTRRALPLIAWHLTLAGNLGAIVTLDPVGFYFWFALLSLAVYVLLVENAESEAQRAGRLYLSVAIGAELLALAAFLLLTAGRARDGAALLLLFGLGAKLGVLPLHFPLPLAYAAATPAVGALFAGALSLATIAGLLRFLPEGASLAGDYALFAGLATAFVGAALGVAQRDPRALLGYSTVSQMGIFTAGFGLALHLPGRGAALAALALFALHHGLVKGALMLGAGGGRRALPWLAALSLALAAAPFTGGAFAKGWIEALAPHEGAGNWLHALLPLSSVATVLLMARFLVLVGAAAPQVRPPEAFLPLALGALVLPVGLAFLWYPEASGFLIPTKLWSSAWPTLFGLALALTVWRWPSPWQPALPPGDMAALLPSIAQRWRRLPVPLFRLPPPPSLAWLEGIEIRLRSPPVTGILFFFLLLALLALGW